MVSLSPIRPAQRSDSSYVARSDSSSDPSSRAIEHSPLGRFAEPSLGSPLRPRSLRGHKLTLGLPLPRTELDGTKSFRPFRPLAFAPDNRFLVGIARDIADGNGSSHFAQIHVWSLFEPARPSALFDAPNDVQLAFDATSEAPAQLWSPKLFSKSDLHFLPEVRLEEQDYDKFIVGEPRSPEENHAYFNDLWRMSNVDNVPLFYSVHPLGGYRALVLGDKLYVQGRDSRRNAILVAKELPGFSLLRGRAPAFEGDGTQTTLDDRDAWRARWHKHMDSLVDADEAANTLERNELRLWWGENFLIVLTRQEAAGIVLYRLDLNRPWYTQGQQVARYGLPGLDYDVDDVLPSPTGRFFSVMAREIGDTRQEVPLLVDCLHPAGPQTYSSPGRLYSPKPQYALSFSPTSVFWVGHAQEHLYAPRHLWSSHELWAMCLVDTAEHEEGDVLLCPTAKRGLAVAVDSVGELCAVQAVDELCVTLEPGYRFWQAISRPSDSPVMTYMPAGPHRPALRAPAPSEQSSTSSPSA